MKRFLNKNILLALSFAWTVAGLGLLLRYMQEERAPYSFERTEQENGVMLLLLFLCGIPALLLNLAGLYKTFCEKLKPLIVLRIALLNFPLLLVQCLLAFAWLALQAVF